MTTSMKKKEYQISAKGSLGLLAFGDLGLKEWRKVKKIEHEKRKDEKR